MVGDKQTIVIVDDEPDILIFLEAMLRDAGYEVVAVEKSEALDQLLGQRRLPALIMLDMLLSGKDGRTISRRLKSQDVTRHIPIIMFSAHPGVAKEALESGADDFIAKPFEMDELLTKISCYV
jgi:DNA-binding response OmpR family regulator